MPNSNYSLFASISIYLKLLKEGKINESPHSINSAVFLSDFEKLLKDYHELIKEYIIKKIWDISIFN